MVALGRFCAMAACWGAAESSASARSRRSGGWSARLSRLRLEKVRRTFTAAIALATADEFGAYLHVSAQLSERITLRTAALGRVSGAVGGTPFGATGARGATLDA